MENRTLGSFEVHLDSDIYSASSHSVPGSALVLEILAAATGRRAGEVRNVPHSRGDSMMKEVLVSVNNILPSY